MILQIFGKSNKATAETLYAAIVAAARQPRFYTTLGVTDDLDGRFEMIVLHLFLTLDRLQGEGEEDLRQALTDTFYRDMDSSLRELGVSDVTVGKRVRRMAEACYGRLLAYDRGLREGPDALRAALARNIYAERVTGTEPVDMASYVMAAQAKLGRLPLEKVKQGALKDL
jgi:cytochrome b pre-mRNA-processing protein 3